jgi:hypothetical protein
MLMSAITLLFLVAQQPEAADSKTRNQGQTVSIRVGEAHQPGGADSSANREIAAPCRLVEESAVQYFKEHAFYANTATKGTDIFITLGPRTGALAPSGKPLSLDRFSIHRYSLTRHLSPLKTYDFRAEGQLRLEEATTAGSCNASLSFDISAYEWVWALAVIDDGYRSQFNSNGELERLYLDAIGNLFQDLRPNRQ